MSTIQLPDLEPEVRPPEIEPVVPTVRATAHLPEPTDAQAARWVRRGLVGVPVLYVIVAALGWLAVPGEPLILLAAVWPALFAGPYFGTMIALTIFELRAARGVSPPPTREDLRTTADESTGMAA